MSWNTTAMRQGADEPVDLSGRQFVLVYESNADPHKLLTKEGSLSGHRVFALRAAVFGWAAVWCNAR